MAAWADWQKLVTFVTIAILTHVVLSVLQLVHMTLKPSRELHWAAAPGFAESMAGRGDPARGLELSAAWPTCPACPKVGCSDSSGSWLTALRGGSGVCGELPPLGTRTVFHPKRPQYTPRIWKADVYVSFDSDRAFAVPLQGMAFDQDSLVYIFYRGGDAATQVQFQFDGGELRTTAKGGPHDLMGHADRFGDRAEPLRTATLGVVGCHTLRVTATGGTRHMMVRNFRVVLRKPKVWVIATVGVQMDLPLLPHFIHHYKSAGISPENFVIVVHSDSPQDPRLAQAKKILEESRVRSVVEWLGVFNTFDKFEIQESLGRRFVLQQDWVMHPDVDEHHLYPTLVPAFIEQCDARGYTAVFGLLHDRVNKDGVLKEVLSDQPLPKQFSLSCHVTKLIVGGSTTKVMMHRGFLMAEEGGYHTLYEWKRTYGRNFARVKTPPFKLVVNHYKWTSMAKKKLAAREVQFKAQGIRWWVQSARGLRYILAGKGRLAVNSSELACRKYGYDASQYALPEITTRRFARGNMDRFTVILMAYSQARHKNQHAILVQLANRRDVHEVIFIWNSPKVALPKLPRQTVAPIRVVMSEKNSLNNRWSSSLGVKTEAVLMMDDDMLLPDQTILSLFKRWQYQPDRLVGVTARNFFGYEYMYPKHCCEKFQSMHVQCNQKTTRHLPAQCANRLPGTSKGQPRFTMDAFCDTFRLVLPKVRGSQRLPTHSAVLGGALCARSQHMLMHLSRTDKACRWRPCSGASPPTPSFLSLSPPSLSRSLARYIFICTHVRARAHALSLTHGTGGLGACTLLCAAPNGARRRACSFIAST